jgi:hypothetical protein
MGSVDRLPGPPPNKALQLRGTARSYQGLVAFWHHPWVPRQLSAARATRLSA